MQSVCTIIYYSIVLFILVCVFVFPCLCHCLFWSMVEPVSVPQSAPSVRMEFNLYLAMSRRCHLEPTLLATRSTTLNSIFSVSVCVHSRWVMVAKSVILSCCTNMCYWYCMLRWIQRVMDDFVVNSYLVLKFYMNFTILYDIPIDADFNFCVFHAVTSKGRILLLPSVQLAHQILRRFALPLLQGVWRSKLATPTYHSYTYLHRNIYEYNRFTHVYIFGWLGFGSCLLCQGDILATKFSRSS